MTGHKLFWLLKPYTKSPPVFQSPTCTASVESSRHYPWRWRQQQGKTGGVLSQHGQVKGCAAITALPADISGPLLHKPHNHLVVAVDHCPHETLQCQPCPSSTPNHTATASWPPCQDMSEGRSPAGGSLSARTLRRGFWCSRLSFGMS